MQLFMLKTATSYYKYLYDTSTIIYNNTKYCCLNEKKKNTYLALDKIAIKTCFVHK